MTSEIFKVVAQRTIQSDHGVSRKLKGVVHQQPLKKPKIENSLCQRFVGVVSVLWSEHQSNS